MNTKNKNSKGKKIRGTQRMAKWRKIRDILYEFSGNMCESEKITQTWMKYPLETFYESFDAGFIYPDESNPVIHQKPGKKFDFNDIKR